MAVCSDRAWNNFVMHSDPASYEHGSSKRAAAIANLFMGGANNGGLNSFLTSSHDLDATEVLDALNALGAAKAAHQLELVLQGLGTSLPATTQEDRWVRLDKCWTECLDKHDVLTRDADAELMTALEKHVAANEKFYSRLD
jgi:hypothetical protein